MDIFGTYLLYSLSYFGLFTAIFFLLTLIENKKRLQNPAIKEYPKVSIIVPAYNEEATIAKTIKSLLKLDWPKNKLEILVIDDGSEDKTYSIAKRFKSKRVKVFTKKNGGKADALNYGLERCSGELVAALDADSFVSPDALKKMIGYFQKSRVMAVTPSLKVYKPKTILQKIQAIEYMVGVLLRKIFSFLGAIHVTPGPFTIYRKRFFDKYGGYDVGNITEDIEIALRIQSRDYEIENSIDASVYTVAPPTFKGLLRQRIRWYSGFIENIIRYFHLFNPKRHGNLALIILPSALISVAFVTTTLLYFTYKYGSKILTHLQNLIAVNFDLSQILKFNIDLFKINTNALLFLAAVGLFFSIMIFALGKTLSKEKGKMSSFYVFYLAFYWVLYGVWWTIVWVCKILGKKVKWRNEKC